MDLCQQNEVSDSAADMNSGPITGPLHPKPAAPDVPQVWLAQHLVGTLSLLSTLPGPAVSHPSRLGEDLVHRPLQSPSPPWAHPAPATLPCCSSEGTCPKPRLRVSAQTASPQSACPPRRAPPLHPSLRHATPPFTS